MKVKTKAMPTRLIFTILFLIFYCGAQSQNLVPNPSFDELRNLPVKPNPKNSFEYEPNSGYIPFQENLSYWFAGTTTTPDLRLHSRDKYNECNRIFKNCDKAHKGSNCVGIITYMSNQSTKEYREYVQVKLKERLRPKETTFVEFWIAKEREAKLVSSNVGCHFSMKKIHKHTLETLDFMPQINCDTIINKDKKEWVKITGSFVPDLPYHFITIGNFYGNDSTQAEKFKHFNGSPYTPLYAYYLIDDVRVWQANDKPVLVYDETEVKLNEPIALKNIEFEFDRSTLRAISFVELEKLKAFLEKNKSVKIAIQGHTDHFGKEEYNLTLSQERAQAVFNYLVDQGIEKDRLSYEGFGEKAPIENNTTTLGRSKNRRVDFLILTQ